MDTFTILQYQHPSIDAFSGSKIVKSSVRLSSTELEPIDLFIAKRTKIVTFQMAQTIRLPE